MLVEVAAGANFVRDGWSCNSCPTCASCTVDLGGSVASLFYPLAETPASPPDHLTYEIPSSSSGPPPPTPQRVHCSSTDLAPKYQPSTTAAATATATATAI